jgi:Ca2+-binding EF-hand superfamily protein
MGNKISSAVGMKRREDVSVIDKLTEAQLDEFREAFNSFDKVCAGCVRAAAVDVALGRDDSLSARTRRNAACV